MIIILALLGNSPLSDHDPEQEERDWNSIYELTRLMNRIGSEVRASVAAQAARLLETLCKLRHEFPDEAFHAVVPYFGEIKIWRCKLPARSTQETSLQDAPTPAEQDNDDQTMGSTQAVFDFNDNFDLEQFQLWPEENQDWTSLVDFNVQDDWYWQFGNQAQQ